MLKISFAPDAKETDIRMLVVQVQANWPAALASSAITTCACRPAAKPRRSPACRPPRSFRPPRWHPACRLGSSAMATQPTRRMLLRCAAWGAAALPFGSAIGGAPANVKGAESRIALVIGNGAYRAAPLKNPPGDAGAVAAALRGLGYDVTLRQNTRLRGADRVAARVFDARAEGLGSHAVLCRPRRPGEGPQLPGADRRRPEVGRRHPAAKCGRRRVRRPAQRHSHRHQHRGARRLPCEPVRRRRHRRPRWTAPEIPRRDARAAWRHSMRPWARWWPSRPRRTAWRSTAPAASTASMRATCWPTCRRRGCRSSSFSSGCVSAWPKTPAASQVPWESSSLTADFCFKSDDKGAAAIARRRRLACAARTQRLCWGRAAVPASPSPACGSEGRDLRPHRTSRIAARHTSRVVANEALEFAREAQRLS